MISGNGMPPDLGDRASACAEVAAWLQPFVDGELGDRERRRIGEHVEGCADCRAKVSQQVWVRAALRASERESAPASLQAKILAALDHVDAETVKPAPPEPGLWAWMRAGGLRPGWAAGAAGFAAVATAAGLWLTARSPDPGAGSHRGEAGAYAHPLEPAYAHRSQIPSPRAPLAPAAEPRDARARIQLVGARLDHATAHPTRPGARLRYRVSHTAGQQLHVIDRQRPGGGPRPVGIEVMFRGQPYTVSHADSGVPMVHFERSGVAHAVTIEGATPTDTRDFAILLDLAHRLAHWHEPH